MFVELNAVQIFSFSFIYVSVSSMFTWIPVFRRKHALLLQARYNNNFESFTIALQAPGFTPGILCSP
jgi:hypothetical protein